MVKFKKRLLNNHQIILQECVRNENGKSAYKTDTNDSVVIGQRRNQLSSWSKS